MDVVDQVGGAFTNDLRGDGPALSLKIGRSFCECRAASCISGKLTQLTNTLHHRGGDTSDRVADCRTVLEVVKGEFFACDRVDGQRLPSEWVGLLAGLFQTHLEVVAVALRLGHLLAGSCTGRLHDSDRNPVGVIADI